MKRILSLILTVIVLLSIVACSGNFEEIELKDSMAIPKDGVISKAVLDELKNEKGIATFTGTSGDLKYEWIVFGSDIDEARDVNLSLVLEDTDGGVKVKFGEEDNFDFPIMLCIYLNEKWEENSATAYEGNSAVYSVSITGSKTSILNMSVNRVVSECIILPDDMGNEETSSVKDENKYVEETTENNKNEMDDYLSDVEDEDNRVYSDGTATNQDKYNTDPIPSGKPMPVEPENQQVDNRKKYTCTFSIECSTILNNLEDLDKDKLELVPSNGMILPPTTVTFYDGESVYDVLQRVCKENKIHMESSWTPIYNSAYVEGINNLYEFDCGELSGWMYRVDGWYPNYGCSRYQLKDGEVVEWRYTCDLGKDVGCDWMQ